MVKVDRLVKRDLLLVVPYWFFAAWLAVFGVYYLFIVALRASLEAAPEGAGPVVEPFVTVQIPVRNERYVVARALEAVSRLDWPRERLEIQVLDDSTDETTGIVAGHVAALRSRGLPVVHIRRERPDGFKAGALNGGLRVARGDVIAMFDADFVPPPDFLR